MIPNLRKSNQPRTARATYYKTHSPKQQTQETIKLIGKTIQACTGYLPIRQHAAKVAARTPGHKNYLGQVQEIYNDVLSHWRYVRDPVGVETLCTSPEGVHTFVMGHNGGLGEGRGAEDCDGVTVAIGSLLQNIGFPVRIATTKPPNARPGGWFTHVFAQAHIPKMGWVTVDPVLHPNRKMGAISPHSAIAFWNLNGQMMGHRGPIPNTLKGETTMLGQDSQEWQDYGLAGSTDEEFPADWREERLLGFGGHVETMGYTDGAGLPYRIEVEPVEINGEHYARTPMIELSASDYQYIQRTGTPFMGMLALGDDGTVYEYGDDYDGMGGFFKRLFKKVKKGIKKGVRWVGKKVKKVIKLLPGGKYLIRLGKKILKVGMKLIRPLMKFVGKYAKYLAPVAALIPGIGPAVAAGLYTAGKIANIMKKFGVGYKKGPKGSKQLKFKSGKQAKQFKDAIKTAAKKEKAKRSKKVRKRRRRPTRGRIVRAGSPRHTGLMRRIRRRGRRRMARRR